MPLKVQGAIVVDELAIVMGGSMENSLVYKKGVAGVKRLTIFDNAMAQIEMTDGKCSVISGLPFMGSTNGKKAK